MITVEHISHDYGAGPTFEVADWALPAGEAALVLGPSGSGKSTFLHILAGLLAPTRGRVIVDAVDITALRPAARDRFRGRTIAIVFQDNHLVSALSVRANLRLACGLAGRLQDDARIEAILDRLALTHRADARPGQLSRGEAQRAALARALVVAPKVILADEPTAALDDANADAVISLLKEASAEAGASLVVATHDQRVKDAFSRQLHLSVP